MNTRVYYVIGNPLDLRHRENIPQLEVERAFPRTPIIHLYETLEALPTRYADREVEIGELTIVKPFFSIIVPTNKLMQPAGVDTAIKAVKREDIFLIASACIPKISRYPRVEFDMSCMMFAAGFGIPSCHFPGSNYQLNKTPLNIGHVKSVEPYLKAWDTKTSCDQKVVLVLNQYQTGGLNRTSKNVTEAKKMAKDVTDRKLDGFGVYTFFQAKFNQYEIDEKQLRKLQEGDYGAALFTIFNRLTPNAVILDYLSALSILQDIGVFILDYAENQSEPDEKMRLGMKL